MSRIISSTEFTSGSSGALEIFIFRKNFLQHFCVVQNAAQRRAQVMGDAAADGQQIAAQPRVFLHQFVN